MSLIIKYSLHHFFKKNKETHSMQLFLLPQQTKYKIIKFNHGELWLCEVTGTFKHGVLDL